MCFKHKNAKLNDYNSTAYKIYNYCYVNGKMLYRRHCGLDPQ